MDVLKIVEYGTKLTESMVILRNQKHAIPALMLCYAAIDQMAWLAIARERSNGSDFKDWVSKFILPRLPGEVTTDELWEARNGLLHMGTAESQANRNDSTIRKVYYTVGGVACTRNDAPDVTFVNSDELFEAFGASVFWFAEDLKEDQSRLSIALKKLERMLSQRDLSR